MDDANDGMSITAGDDRIDGRLIAEAHYGHSCHAFIRVHRQERRGCLRAEKRMMLDRLLRNARGANTLPKS